MIIYTFQSSQNLNGKLNDIVNAIESNYNVLIMNTFLPSALPATNTEYFIHGAIGISNNNGKFTIQVIFFETSDNYNTVYKTNNITLTWIGQQYNNIPTQEQLQKVISTWL